MRCSFHVIPCCNCSHKREWAVFPRMPARDIYGREWTCMAAGWSLHPCRYWVCVSQLGSAQLQADRDGFNVDTEAVSKPSALTLQTALLSVCDFQKCCLCRQLQRFWDAAYEDYVEFSVHSYYRMWWPPPGCMDCRNLHLKGSLRVRPKLSFFSVYIVNNYICIIICIRYLSLSFIFHSPHLTCLLHTIDFSVYFNTLSTVHVLEML